jgi:PKD repeat protein
VNDYSGSGTNNYPVRLTTEFSATGSGTWTTLGVEDCDIQSEANIDTPENQPYAYPLNDHVMKVYSDYEAWYDVTSLITTTTPQIRVTASDIGAPVGADGGFDGRIKAVTLVVAYDDGSTNQVKYVVNHGNDWIYSGLSSSTPFDASSFASGWTSAKITSIAHSSTDANPYKLNGATITKTSLGTNSYWKYNSFDVMSALTPAASNTFGFTSAGASFKICIAALTAKYVPPTAAYTYAPTTVLRGSPVSFDASTSTGSITSYTWDFAGTAGSGKTTSYTFATTGPKIVRLTVDGPMGSNYVEQTINVKEPAPVVDFTGTPTSGTSPLTVAFTATNTGGAVNTYDWTFGDGATQTTTGPTVSHTYTTATPQIYTVSVLAHGPDYDSTLATRSNYITVGAQIIDVSVTQANIPFGTMSTAAPSTGSTQVAVATTGGTAWSVTGAANNGGYMKAGSNQLANAFQLANGGGAFSPMTSDFLGFMTGAADEDRTDTANVEQVIGSGDQPGSYSITLTFTGAFS